MSDRKWRAAFESRASKRKRLWEKKGGGGNRAWPAGEKLA